jgi:Fur family transcriptional regulator, peroxide stress response regulator
MPRKQDELSQRMDLFKDALKHNGVKLTHQRMIIFNEVAESKEHPNVESVYNTVRKKLPMVSLDTVYRTLWMLQDLRLILILGARDRVRFDGNMKPHHHFICNECGLMRDFYSNEFDLLKIPKEVKNFGNGKTVHIEIQGICTECSKKSMVKPPK